MRIRLVIMYTLLAASMFVVAQVGQAVFGNSPLGVKALFFLACFIVMLLLFLYLGQRFILRHIRAFIDLARRVGENDLSGQLKIQTGDEFQELGDSMNNMTAGIRGVLSDNLTASERLSQEAQELSQLANQSSRASELTNRIVEEMARGIQEQSSSITQTADAAEQMARSAGQVADEAQKAATLSGQASQRARAGAQLIHEVQDNMSQLKSAVDNSADVVKRLGVRSQEIGKIVDVIRGISRQTNLLALNASIEAARAGEHGRGFSVVAEEVRALAEQTTTSAAQIVSLIQEIQSETLAAVEAMEAGTRAVEAGSVLSTKASEAFNEIFGSVAQTVQTIQEIAAAAEEQAASSQEMTSTMETVSEIASQNTGRARQVAEGVQEQRTLAGNVAQAAGSLVEMADRLTSMVGRFKVKNDFQPCWILQGCNYLNCPAFQSPEEKCWLVPNTLCDEGRSTGSVSEKRTKCHQCEVFKVNTAF